jgi:hypothetical protein
MKLKDKLIAVFFGNLIDKKVGERIQAASMTDYRKEDEGWRRLTSADSQRSLDSLKQERMIEICFYLWENNPMAKWLIDITTNFILAEGMPYEAENEAVKDVLDGFWADPINRMDLYLKKFVDELFIYGELCLPAFVAEQTGRVRLGYIDPVQIKEAVTDPENVKMVIGIILKDRTGKAGRKYQTILPEGADYVLSEEAQQMRKGYADGECFFFAINNVTNSPRGRSELLPVADWLDSYEQFLFDAADKWSLLIMFVWDLLVDGGNDEDIKKQMAAFIKKAGAVYGHNEKVTLEARAPDLKSFDVENAARLFRNHILGPFSYPEHWYGGGGDVNRATAVEMGAPAFKTLAAKQMQVKYIIENIFAFVIRKSREANFLRVSDDEAKDYSVVTPEIATKDISKYSTVIQQVAAALVSAEMNGWIDKKTARQVFANIIGYLGIELDTGDIEQKLTEEEGKKGYEDYEDRKE